MEKHHTQQLLLAWEEGVAVSVEFLQQILCCQRNCGFVLRQTELLSMHYLQSIDNYIEGIVVVTSPQAKASSHSDVSLNNIFYNYATKKNLLLAYKLHRSSLWAYTMAILQGIIPGHYGFFCPSKAQNARAIMDGQHYNQIVDTLWNHQSWFHQHFPHHYNKHKATTTWGPAFLFAFATRTQYWWLPAHIAALSHPYITSPSDIFTQFYLKYAIPSGQQYYS